MTRKITIPFVILIFIVIFLLLIYFQPQRKIEHTNPHILSANELFQIYSTSEKHGDSLFLDQPIQIFGKVSEVKLNQDNVSVILLSSEDPLFGIACTMKERITEIKIQDSVTIKGFCSGFTSDVVLRDCILVR